MKIFSDKNSPGTPTLPNAIRSIIGQDMTIVGDLSFKSKIQIDGRIQGNLTGTSLVVSETGRIVGNVLTESLVCYGQIDGDLTVGKLFLKKTGVINGRVETSDLSVESGGSLNGEIKSLAQGHGFKVLPSEKPSAPPSPEQPGGTKTGNL
ncbi:MAG: polymer-forming cytoskeletal protein [Desulfobulbaceae bacterium]|nr:polymer-forming cytoskeletal protein [Desulfobulbaceae bacterium]